MAKRPASACFGGGGILADTVKLTLGPKGRNIVIEKAYGTPVVTNEPPVILHKVTEGTENFGFNAQVGTYGDMVEMGIMDPAKVVRVAL